MSLSYDRRITPARSDLAAESMRGKIDATRYVAGHPMRVVDEVVGLRGEPRRDRSLDTQALFGERVIVYEVDEEGWAWGQLERDSYVGYMPAEALRNDVRTPTHRVRTIRTFVYPAPNIKSPAAMALPMGAEICVTALRESFAEISGGGFVWAAHLSALRDFEADFVAVAESFINVPYLWGGKTSEGLDCSGLIQISLAACGIASPRDTDMMATALGEKVSGQGEISDIRRGDLVFWKGHVGVMRNAETLLHANGHHMLVVSESFKAARERIAEKSFGDIVSVRRFRK